jgi:hypothetical protein
MQLDFHHVAALRIYLALESRKQWHHHNHPKALSVQSGSLDTLYQSLRYLVLHRVPRQGRYKELVLNVNEVLSMGDQL